MAQRGLSTTSDEFRDWQRAVNDFMARIVQGQHRKGRCSFGELRVGDVIILSRPGGGTRNGQQLIAKNAITGTESVLATLP